MQCLKKTFITTVLTAVKKNKQPTHSPGGPGRLRSWSGPVETDFQGRLRFSYDNRPAPKSSKVGSSGLGTREGWRTSKSDRSLMSTKTIYYN
jgi:hypothetical protein